MSSRGICLALDIFFHFALFVLFLILYIILRQRSNYLSPPPTSQSAITLSSLSLLFLVSKVKSIFIIVFSRYFYWSFFKWQFLKHCGCFHYDYLFVFQFLTFLKCLDRFHFAARFGPVFCCTTWFSVVLAWWWDAACVKESVGNWNTHHILSRCWRHVLILLGCGVQPPFVAASLAHIPKIPGCFGDDGLHAWNLQSTAVIRQPIVSNFCHVTVKFVVNVR